MGEAPAYAFRPRASAKRALSSPISASTRAPSWTPGREAEDDLSVRVLRESLFDRLGEVVGGGAGGLQLEQEGEQLLAQRVLDQRRLVGPVGPEDLAEPFGFSVDAALAAGPLERGLQLRAGQPRGLGRRRGRSEELMGLAPAETVAPGGEAARAAASTRASRDRSWLEIRRRFQVASC